MAGFSLEFERGRQSRHKERDKIASWSSKMVANVIGAKKPPWMEMDQWWRLWHRTGHRWIEKCNMNELTAIRERALSWAGHVARLDYKEICAKALRCRGLQGNGDSSTGKKWRRTSGLVRTHNDSTFSNGSTWCRQRSPSLPETEMALRNQSTCPRLAPTCSRSRALETVCKI